MASTFGPSIWWPKSKKMLSQLKTSQRMKYVMFHLVHVALHPKSSPKRLWRKYQDKQIGKINILELYVAGSCWWYTYMQYIQYYCSNKNNIIMFQVAAKRQTLLQHNKSDTRLCYLLNLSLCTLQTCTVDRFLSASKELEWPYLCNGWLFNHRAEETLVQC